MQSCKQIPTKPKQANKNEIQKLYDLAYRPHSSTLKLVKYLNATVIGSQKTVDSVTRSLPSIFSNSKEGAEKDVALQIIVPFLQSAIKSEKFPAALKRIVKFVKALPSSTPQKAAGKCGIVLASPEDKQWTKKWRSNITRLLSRVENIKLDALLEYELLSKSRLLEDPDDAVCIAAILEYRYELPEAASRAYHRIGPENFLRKVGSSISLHAGPPTLWPNQQHLFDAVIQSPPRPLITDCSPTSNGKTVGIALLAKRISSDTRFAMVVLSPSERLQGEFTQLLLSMHVMYAHDVQNKGAVGNWETCGGKFNLCPAHKVPIWTVSPCKAHSRVKWLKDHFKHVVLVIDDYTSGAVLGNRELNRDIIRAMFSAPSSLILLSATPIPIPSAITDMYGEPFSVTDTSIRRSIDMVQMRGNEVARYCPHQVEEETGVLRERIQDPMVRRHYNVEDVVRLCGVPDVPVRDLSLDTLHAHLARHVTSSDAIQTGEPISLPDVIRCQPKIFHGTVMCLCRDQDAMMGRLFPLTAPVILAGEALGREMGIKSPGIRNVVNAILREFEECDERNQLIIQKMEKRVKNKTILAELSSDIDATSKFSQHIDRFFKTATLKGCVFNDIDSLSCVYDEKLLVLLMWGVGFTDLGSGYYRKAVGRMLQKGELGLLVAPIEYAFGVNIPLTGLVVEDSSVVDLPPSALRQLAGRVSRGFTLTPGKIISSPHVAKRIWFDTNCPEIVEIDNAIEFVKAEGNVC